MREGRVCSIAVLLFLSILNVTIAVPIRAEEEYRLVTTLQSPIPHGLSGFGGIVELGDGFLAIGEWDAFITEELTAGKIYIYDLDWNLINTIQAPEPMPNEQFSRSFEVFDDLIIVGNSYVNLEDHGEAGEVYLFDPEGTLLLTIQSPNPMDHGYFGSEVDLRNGIILVGESGGNVLGYNTPGLVHAFDMDGVHITTLMAPSITPSGVFGRDIVMNDEFIAISETGLRDSPIENCSVHIFDYSFNHVTTLQSPDHQTRTKFGQNIELTNDLMLVSEWWATVEGHERAGRAHLYDSEWNLLMSFQAPDPEDNAEFGLDVCICGDMILLGERKRDVDVINEGMVYVYDLDGELLTTFVSHETEIGAQFGYEIETYGETIIVAHVEATAGGVSKAGKVEIYAPGPPVEEPQTEEEPSETSTESESGNKGIPGFPYDSIIIGIVSVALAIWLGQRKQ